MSSFAQDVFAVNPGITAENDILALGFEIVKKALGPKSARYYFWYHEDFPSDLISEYFWLQQEQTVDQ
jgi:hypothetical protein